MSVCCTMHIYISSSRVKKNVFFLILPTSYRTYTLIPNTTITPKAMPRPPKKHLHKRLPTVLESYPKLDGEQVSLKNKVILKSFKPIRNHRPGKSLCTKKSPHLKGTNLSQQRCQFRNFAKSDHKRNARDNNCLVGVQSTRQRERNLHHNH